MRFGKTSDVFVPATRPRPTPLPCLEVVKESLGAADSTVVEGCTITHERDSDLRDAPADEWLVSDQALGQELERLC